MAGTDSGNKSGIHTSVQQHAKVPRQAKLKDSRQIQTQDNGNPAGSTSAKKANFREAAKAVGMGNREILSSKRLFCLSHLLSLIIRFVNSYEASARSDRR